MIRRLSVLAALALAGPGASLALAQGAISLDDAVARALARHPAVAAAAAAERAATARVSEARAGRLPSADVVEGWQRGNQPVYAFGSLLAQRRFLSENLALDALNHPPATNNLRLGVTVEQPLFNRATDAGVRGAASGEAMAGIARTAVAADLRLATTAAYAGVLSAIAVHMAADRALEAAVADRDRTGHRRDAGRATDADVLQFDVHVARAQARQAQAVAGERVARAHLNGLIGEPLDAPTAVMPVTAERSPASATAAPVVAPGVGGRPDVRLAAARETQARAAVDGARAAFLPQVSAQAGWEANGGSWGSRSPSWAVGVVGRLNVFRGFGDQARLSAARSDAEQRAAERRQVESAAEVEILSAQARLTAAEAADAAMASVAAQARESQRIVRERYEQGLAESVALLRAAELVYESDAAQATAAAGVLTARAELDRAQGSH